MRIFLLIVFSTLTTFCFSQIKFSVSSGLNISSLHKEWEDSDSIPQKSNLGMRVGFTVEKNFNEKIGIRLELNYSEGGAKVGNEKINVSYLSMPVSFYYSPINNLKVYGGPEVNIKLTSNSSASFGRWVSPFEKFEQIDYGAQVGLEYLIFQRFGIGIKNYFGFQYNGKMRGYRFISGSDPIIDNSKINRNNIFGVYLTYLVKS